MDCGIFKAAESGEDLMALGQALGADSRLKESEYQTVVETLSGALFASEITTIVENAIEHRPVPLPGFWRNVILNSKDFNLGAGLVGVLAPWIDITDLICELLSLSGLRSSEQTRVANTVWNAACGGSIELHSTKEFHNKELLDRVKVKRAIEAALPRFKGPSVQMSLRKALDCLTDAE